jgi:hypothetical protein
MVTTCKWMERPSTVTHHPQAQPSQPPCRWQGPPPPSAFTLVNTALNMVQAVLASSCVPLLGQGVLPALHPSTSLTLPRPPAWTALLASSPMPLAQPSWLTALAALLGSILKLEPAPPVLSASTSLTLLPPPVWTALLASSPQALGPQSALGAPLGPTLQAAVGPSPLAAVCVQWLILMVNPASRTQLGTMKQTRTAPSPSQGLAQ